MPFVRSIPQSASASISSPTTVSVASAISSKLTVRPERKPKAYEEANRERGGRRPHREHRTEPAAQNPKELDGFAGERSREAATSHRGKCAALSTEAGLLGVVVAQKTLGDFFHRHREVVLRA